MVDTLIEEYTFENFVVGGSNRLAHAGALSVTERSDRRYNPLYVYGDKGLGKTHLLHAIGHRARSEGGLVLYLTAEEYRNKVLWSVRNNEPDYFRARYYSLNFLLFDDASDLGQMEEVQERFFHWFNTLHLDRSQIVIAGSRHPRSMPLLDDRLRSRFEWGLVTEITPPNLETRLAILQAKADAKKVELDPEVLDLIAHRAQTDIKSLEGALNCVLNYKEAHQVKKISFEMAVEALEAVNDRTRRLSLQPDSIIRATGEKFAVPEDVMKGPKRDREIVLARHVTMFLMREGTSPSLAGIGRELGGGIIPQ
ncbi:chromosomal replication initiator protein DnaA [Candidatus Daviesbacteria bacterium]|nr:chromosomal replication initiator protein DnaA [Candidatus Daviesbacteria bacterium]